LHFLVYLESFARWCSWKEHKTVKWPVMLLISSHYNLQPLFTIWSRLSDEVGGWDSFTENLVDKNKKNNYTSE